SASAQGRVTGTVKNADGRPVKGAIVTAENPDASASNLRTTTNAKGKYAFLGLRGGAWTFTAEAPGLMAAERQMDVRMLGDNAAAAIAFGAVASSCHERRTDWFERRSDQNILLVTIDTLRADALSAYGGPARTPNIDALAAGGVRFDFAHAHAVLTRPSHASIL